MTRSDLYLEHAEAAPQVEAHPFDAGHVIPATITGRKVVFDSQFATEAEASEARMMSLVMEVLETVVLAVVIWLAVNFATARYVVEGVSMEPNLETGQFLIVDRLTYRYFGEPQRGDIIVFDYPGNTSDDYVKRIIGLPGERVRIQDGEVYINDVLLAEPYLNDDTPGFHEEVVPEDAFFVMGDNRDSSSDSRSWGHLGDNFIIGKAWVSYWPPSTWGLIPHYSYNVE